jgi:hypothetical protein
MIDEARDEAEKDEVVVLSDGAVVINGRLLTEAETETLDDALGREVSGEVAVPGIHSPEIAKVLAMPPEADPGAPGRDARLAAINKLLAENSAPQDDDVPTSDSSHEDEREEKETEEEKQ